MIECPCLGTLSRVRIGHDNKGGSAGWFLDKVILFEVTLEFVFQIGTECSRPKPATKSCIHMVRQNPMHPS